MSKVTSYQIKEALARKHEDREFFITECKNGPTGVAPGRLLLFDGLAIYKSWTNPKIVGYEIKVSRSDFLSDTKYTQYMPYCHELYFVTPKGMVQRQEVDESLGLMWYNPETQVITTKRKAIYRKIEINANMLLYIIMNRLDSDRHPFHSSKTEYWKDWLENKISNRELGHHVESKLLEQNNELKEEIQRYRHFKERLNEYQEIIKVLENHGIQRWRNVPEALDAALTHSYPPELDTVSNKLHGVIEEIDKLKMKEKVS